VLIATIGKIIKYLVVFVEDLVVVNAQEKRLIIKGRAIFAF
jgi:hypothetical protein